MIMRVRRFVVFVVIRGMGILYILLTVMEIYVVFHDQYVAQYTHTYIYRGSLRRSHDDYARIQNRLGTRPLHGLLLFIVIRAAVTKQQQQQVRR